MTVSNEVAIITDTHWGARGDNQVVAAHIIRFYDEVFFPELDKLGIKRILHLGDIMDRRKFVSYLTIKQFREHFIKPIIQRGIRLDVVIGNHDTFYKNTNEVNCMEQLLDGINYSEIYWYTKPTEIDLNGLPLLLIPWVCPENVAETSEALKNTTCTMVAGHLEFAGFEMYRGSVSDHGFSTEEYQKFDAVLTGHYHHKSSRGNVHYLGSPYEMTWSDYDDDRGFHIIDPEKKQLRYIKNPLNLFHKLFYDDSGKQSSYINEFDVTKLRGCFVKLVVRNKTNPFWFDILANKLAKAGLADLQIVDDHMNVDLSEDDVEALEDTQETIVKYASQSPYKDTKALERLLSSLYTVASQME